MPYTSTEGALVSVWWVVAGMFWVGAVALVAVAFAVSNPHLGDVGIVVALAGVTLTQKCFLIRQRRLISAAFEAGRESVIRVERFGR